ncbi:hypothetical protein Tco_1236284 [Tanacetum coccineum]
MSYTTAAAAAVAAVLASHQIRLRRISRIDSYFFKVEGAEKLEMKLLIFKVGKLWWLRRRREIVEYREVVTSLFLIRCHGLINKHRSRVLIENQSCRKASEKSIIEWESVKTVVEELVFKAPLD